MSGPLRLRRRNWTIALLAVWIVFSSLLYQSWSAPVVPQMIPGWRMELVLESPKLNHPSVVCAAPDGRVFVAEDPMDIRPDVPAESAAGRILCLHPDGTLTVYAEHLHAVFGMQYLEGYLYVLHNPKFSRFTDGGRVGRDRIELIEQTTLRPWALDWNDHVPANFRLGMDGYFYVAVGDKGLFGAVGRDGSSVTLHGGGILRLRPDGTRLEIFSRGVRNIMDVVLNASDERFTYDNTDEHDWMGRLTHMVDQGSYGYPHDFIPRRPYTLWMMHDFGGGAATGIECDNGAALPAEYRGNLFLGDFGKRQILRVQVERQGATYRVVRHQEMFVNPPEEFRPVGIAWSEDERSLWICDWAHRDTKEAVRAGRLWRATCDAAKPVARPSWFLPAALGRPVQASTDALIQGLSHPSRSVRMMAQRRLSERVSESVSISLTRAAGTEPMPEAGRAHALWALGSTDAAMAVSLARRWLESTNAPLELQRQAARFLGERGTAAATPLLAARLMDAGADASVRFQAATALGRIGDGRSVPALISAAGETDSFLRFAAFTALNAVGRRHTDQWPRLVAALGDSRPRVREGAGFALRQTFDPVLIRILLQWSERSADAAGRESVMRLIAEVARQKPAWDGGWWAYHPALSPAPRATVDWEATPWIRAHLVSGLGDASARVRVAAIEGLVQMGDAWSSGEVVRLLNRESDLVVRRAGLRALTAFHTPQTAVWIAAFLRAPVEDLESMREAVRAAVAIRGEESSKALQEFAATKHPARVEAIAALGELKRDGAIALLNTLSQDSAEAVRTAAIRALGELKSAAALEVLLQRMAPARGADRSAIVRALGTLQLPEAVPALMSLWREPEMRSEAFDALCRRPDSRALDAYLDGLGQVNPTVRERSRKALRGIRDEVLTSVEPKVPNLSARTLAELRQVYADHPGAAKGPVFKFKLKEVLPTAEDYARFAMENPGDAVAGQRVFWDATGVACIRCHAVAGQGSTLGPDMTAIGAQFGRRELIENVLYPSRSVREGYQQVLIETRDGESYSGIVRSETADAVSLVDALGQARPISKASILTRTNSPLSLMPEGLQTGLSREQFADLIAFLESRRGDPRAKGIRSAPEGWTALLAESTDGIPKGWVELPPGTQRVDESMLQRGRPAEHWTLKDGVLEHDGLTGDLWTSREWTDFELSLEWRWSGAFTWEEFPLINADGLEAGPDGRAATRRVLDAGDSGVLLRGLYKAQANLFCYPVGSGEFWEYRTDPNSTAAHRRAFTPKRNADRPLGDWNAMRIRLVGSQVTVWVNGEEVIHEAELPGVPARGAIGLQHEHGRLQFRNVFARELPR